MIKIPHEYYNEKEANGWYGSVAAKIKLRNKELGIYIVYKDDNHKFEALRKLVHFKHRAIRLAVESKSRDSFFAQLHQE